LSNVKKKTTEKESFKEGLVNYFKGVKLEWSRITWPERRQVVVETLIVLFIVFLFTTLIYIMDLLFRGLLGFIPSR